VKEWKPLVPAVCDITIQHAVYVNMLESMPAPRAVHAVPSSAEPLKVS